MNSKFKRVAIIGAGNLGRRHLQSLSLCKEKIFVHVVDPSKEMLELATEVAGSSGFLVNISYHQSIDELSEDIDLAIVATTAKVRLSILKDLIGKNTRNIVLEKVAFNSISDINKGVNLFKTWEGRAWVNCPRREYKVYQKIKALISSKRLLEFRVRGQGFGLACNGIHFMDLAAFLIDCDSYTISNTEIVKIVESKRGGYVEFYGKLMGDFSSGCIFSLECAESAVCTGYLIEMVFEGGKLVVNEMEGFFALNDLDKEVVESFNMPYQSELTGPMVDSILTGFGCALVDFESSMNIHYPFIEAAYNVFAKQYGSNEEKMVPIT